MRQVTMIAFADLSLPSSELLRAVVDHAPDALLVVDSSGRIVLANDAAEDLFGRSAWELVGTSVDALVPPRLRAAHAAHRSAYVAAPTRRTMGNRRLPALRADGTEITTEIAISSVRVDGIDHAIVALRDVSARVVEEDRLRWLGTHDGLTELYNRAFFEAEKSRLAQGRVTPISVIVIDVDDLKSINDRLGHAAGDQHLRRIAAVLRDSFRAEDVVARLGGDEFVVLLPGVDPAQCTAAIERLAGDLRRVSEIAPHPLAVSIGAATTRRADAITAALRLADERMYEAKRGRHAGRPAGVQ